RTHSGCAAMDRRNPSTVSNLPRGSKVMILEIAVFTIQPGKEEQFEAVFPTAAKVLGSSKGYVSHELQRSIETPNRYNLFVQWQTLEDHTEGFRGSPLFTQWRGHIGPFFAAPPAVEHCKLIAGDRGR